MEGCAIIFFTFTLAAMNSRPHGLPFAESSMRTGSKTTETFHVISQSFITRHIEHEVCRGVQPSI